MNAVTIAIISGLFALIGAFIGGRIQRDTAHKKWLLEHRAKSFCDFLLALSNARSELFKFYPNPGKNNIHTEAKTYEIYHSVFIHAKIVRLFLSEKNKDKFIHLVESTCSLDAERPFTLKKLSEIETNIKQIQSIFEDDLINPIMNKQLINTLKKLIAKILKWQP